MLKKCAYCGKEFEATCNANKYCSPACQRAAENEKRRKRKHLHRANTEGVKLSEIEGRIYGLRFCARFGCHKQFIPKSDNQKYCSHECAKMDRSVRERERRQENKKYKVCKPTRAGRSGKSLIVASRRMCKYDFCHKLMRDLGGKL